MRSDDLAYAALGLALCPPLWPLAYGMFWMSVGIGTAGILLKP